MKLRWRQTGSFAWHPWDDGKLAIVHFADQSYSVNPIIRHQDVTTGESGISPACPVSAIHERHLDLSIHCPN